MDIIVVTPPTLEPVTPLEAMFHLKITADPDYTAEDDPLFDEITRQIASARAQCEQHTRRAFIQQTLRLVRGPAQRGEYVRRHSCFDARPWPVLELLRPPLISVSSVKYYDDANVLQTVSPSDYYVTSGNVPTVEFKSTAAVPSLYLRQDAIQLEYVAGYPGTDTSADNVPASIKAAVLLGVQLESDRLDPREREALENAQCSLLSSYRIARA